VTARWKALVCGSSLAGISSSNPAEGHGCLFFVSVVCCQVGSLWRAGHPCRGVLPSVVSLGVINPLKPNGFFAPAASHLLRSWVRLPPGALIFVCCECRVLSGRGLCDELIARPEEPYRLCCVAVCDLEISRICTPYIHDISHLRVKPSDRLPSILTCSQFSLGFRCFGRWVCLQGWV
jgi:hypothetical protein